MNFNVFACVVLRGLVCLLVGLSLGMVPTGAWAQSAADAALRQAEQIARDRQMQDRQRQFEQDKRTHRPPQGLDVSAPDREVGTPHGACLGIRTIEVTGVRLLKPSRIRDVASRFEGRCLGLSEMNALLKEITFLYLKNGYVTSRAFLKEQDLSDGTLEVVVVEGTLAAIVMDGDPSARQIAMAFPGLVGRPLNLRDLEQGLEQMNRLGSNAATMALDAGEEPGTSVVQIARNSGRWWHASLGFDTLGSSSTGVYQSRIDLGFDDLLGLNDQWNFSYQRSMDDHPLSFTQVPSSDTYMGSVSIPYGYWTLLLDANLSEYSSDIPGPVGDIDTAGFSQSISARLSRVLHRDQVSMTSLSGRLKWKRTKNFILGNQVDVSSRDLAILTLEFIHSRRLWDGQLMVIASYHQGLNIFGAFDDGQAPAGSPKGQFTVFNGSISYFKPFKIAHLSASYQGRVTGQYTPHLLFSSEQVAYGGYSTVRGVRESAVFGNNGIMVTNEIAIQLPEIENAELKTLFGSIEVYGGIDFGHVFRQNRFGIEGGSLAGVTVGLRSRGGRVSFEVAWSDIIASSRSLGPAVSKSGLVYGRVSIAL